MSSEILQNHLHEQILEDLKVPVCVCDTEGKIFYMNPSAQHLTQCSLKQGKQIECNQILNCSGGNIPCPHVSRLSRGESCVYSEQFAANGSSSQFDVSVFPLHEAGKTSGAILMMNENSATKMQKDSESFDGAGSVEREIKAEQIESARLDSLGAMATGVAHELNQPLQIIELSAELCMRQLSSELTGKFQTYLERICQQVKRASTVTWHLKTFAQEKGHEKQHIDLNVVVRDSLLLMRSLLAADQIQIQEEYSSHPLYIHAEKNELERAFRNLLVNAKESIGVGGGCITVRSYLEGNQVILEIEDSGKGIASEIEHRIFEPFFTTKGVGEGMGLGLSVSYGIIKAHQGKIAVKTQKQTLFHIALPHSPLKENAI